MKMELIDDKVLSTIARDADSLKNETLKPCSCCGNTSFVRVNALTLMCASCWAIRNG